MRVIYQLFIPLFILLLVSSMVFGMQQSEQNSSENIKQKCQNAREHILSHDFDKAIDILNEANQLVLTNQNNTLKSEVLQTFVFLYFSIQNYEKADIENIKAITLLQKNNRKSSLARAYTMQGLILTQKGNFNQAEKYFNDADEMLLALNDEKNQANVIIGLGILELKRGNPKRAVNYFDAGIPLYKDFNFTFQEAYSYLNKAEALLNLEPTNDTQNIALAKEAYDNAMSIIDTSDYKGLKVESYNTAYLIAKKQNKVVEAQENLLLYASQKEAIFKSYIAVNSMVSSIESNLGDLTEIIETQQNDLDKKKKSLIFGKMTNGLSIALIVILSLLVLSLYKNNNLRAKANELLQDKNNELQLAKEKAEKASLAKAQFLSTITHELRTPLYAVTGLTHLLMEENPKEYQKEHLNSLKFSGEYLLSLINNILDLNKLEANKVEVEKTTFNLKKRINDVLIALKKSADDKKTKLHLEFDDTIPEKLSGDPLKLSQILINLIGNSVKFTQNGDVYVRVSKLDLTKNKVMLHFEVEDNGVGISKKKQKSIFETFAQGSLQINRKFGGTGLGLSIVKNLLELMNSKIKLESELGKGSKFWFNINFIVADANMEEGESTETTLVVDYDSLENKKVLVVEDNKINQMITKKILEKNKMDCMVADNGIDAIKMVKQHKYDIILMDIHMPGISGIEATQKIRKFDTDIPIIALTAVTIDDNLDDFYRAGFNEIIPKPFKPEEFFEKIYKVINFKLEPENS